MEVSTVMVPWPKTAQYNSAAALAWPSNQRQGNILFFIGKVL
jgi:hypothetical protein